MGKDPRSLVRRCASNLPGLLSPERDGATPGDAGGDVAGLLPAWAGFPSDLTWSRVLPFLWDISLSCLGSLETRILA